jgi:tetrahydromethanopterin S-methyltransferase subunit B
VNTWSVVFLGIIAIATLATAIFQVSFLVAAGRLVRRLGQFVDDVERDVRPIVGNLNSVSRDASRAAAIAVAQVERVDALCTDVVSKLDQTITTIHSAIVKPAREGRAWILGFQAMMAAIREFRSAPSRPRGRDEDEGLFI